MRRMGVWTLLQRTAHRVHDDGPYLLAVKVDLIQADSAEGPHCKESLRGDRVEKEGYEFS